MDDTIHVAIIRRIRKEYTKEFERMLAEFASRTVTDPNSRGLHMLFPPPGSDSNEYGILRSFSSAEARNAFYDSAVYKDWLKSIAHMVEGEPVFRELTGLEAWFREPKAPMPAKWKMVLLTWIAVWPVSMAVPAVLLPLLSPKIGPTFRAGLVAAGIVVVLTWVAMPLLVKLARPWLHRPPASREMGNVGR
jgi:antibiotic biosynthesis monooxygenase (ABM) superfamily enzyme